MANHRIHLTTKSVTPFAAAKAPPLFVSNDAGVRLRKLGKNKNDKNKNSTVD